MEKQFLNQYNNQYNFLINNKYRLKYNTIHNRSLSIFTYIYSSISLKSNNPQDCPQNPYF